MGPDSLPEESSVRLPGLLTLRVLIAYEDFGAAVRARCAIDGLLQQFGGSLALSARLWRLELLREPFLLEQAAGDAAAADIVVLSVHRHDVLPVGITECLKRWLCYKDDRPYAFGLLMDPLPSGAARECPVAVAVQRLAQAGGADLFCGSCDAPLVEVQSLKPGVQNRVGPTPDFRA